MSRPDEYDRDAWRLKNDLRPEVEADYAKRYGDTSPRPTVCAFCDSVLDAVGGCECPASVAQFGVESAARVVGLERSKPWGARR